jgi:N-acetylneuraminic acid mutarotase
MFLNGENFAGSLTSFNGKLWMICGGGTGYGSGDARKSVWSSADGITWKQEQDFPGSERYYTDVCVWDNKLWVVGGYNYVERNIRSIWYMTAKGTWTELQTPDTYLGRHATAVGAFNNKLVIANGNYNNDCWAIDKLQ